MFRELMGDKPKAVLQAGDEAPLFELKDTVGGTQALSKLLENSPALLFFFKVSCPVCQMTAPFVERLAAGNAVQVIGVSQDERDATAEFTRRFRLTFPVLLDSVRAGYQASNGFGLSSVPSLFMVEPDRRISSACAGFSKLDLAALGKRMGVELFKIEDKVPLFRAG